jgi:TetR/AcrR family transcriptional regulator, transcriptional repressor for nem operon
MSGSLSDAVSNLFAWAWPIPTSRPPGIERPPAMTPIEARLSLVIDRPFQNGYSRRMARPKLFDPDEALDAAVAVFREHGYAGTSAEMLIDAMQIGKQSLYNTFGGKWPLYCSALERYAASETDHHIAALKSGATALAGIERMMKRVVAKAHMPCLGVNSISEFGIDSEGSPDLIRIREVAGQVLRAVLLDKIREAQTDGDLSAELNANHAAAFVLANIAAIRLAARGGAGDTELRALARLSLQALK